MNTEETLWTLGSGRVVYPVNQQNGPPAGSERRPQRIQEKAGQGSKSTTMNPP